MIRWKTLAVAVVTIAVVPYLIALLAGPKGLGPVLVLLSIAEIVAVSFSALNGGRA